MRTLTKQQIKYWFATSYAGGGDATCTGAGQSFNGTDQYASVTDNGALDIAEATTDFCLTAKITTTDLSVTQIITGKSFDITLNGRYYFLTAGGTMRFSFETSTGQVNISNNSSLSNNVEYHCAGRIDLINSKAYFYIDGVLQNSGGTSFTGTFINTPNTIEYRIGNSNDDGAVGKYWFNGTVKDNRIYHKDVTANLTELMAGEKLGDEVAWWCLPALEGFDNTSFDLTGVNL